MVHGLSCPRHVGSSQTRARTCVPCTGRWIPNHCATREAPLARFKNTSLSSIEFACNLLWNTSTNVGKGQDTSVFTAVLVCSNKRLESPMYFSTSTWLDNFGYIHKMDTLKPLERRKNYLSLDIENIQDVFRKRKKAMFNTGCRIISYHFCGGRKGEGRIYLLTYYSKSPTNKRVVLRARL